MRFRRDDLSRSAAQLWGGRREWPAVTPRGKLFMGDAIQQLGERLHGADWTGKEPVAGPVRYYEGRVEPAWVAGKQSAERWATVWPQLCQWLVDGDLPVWGRNDLGELVECEASVFASDDASAVVASCRVLWVPRSYFGGSEWLLAFVDAEAFATLVGGRKPNETPDWWPPEGMTDAKPWCALAPVLAEAKRRARYCAVVPGQSDWSRMLRVMWAEATGKELGWKTFEQYLIEHKSNREDMEG